MGKTREQLAREAQKTHERLCERVETEARKPGITKLRHKLSDALHARMKAERKAGLI